MSEPLKRDLDADTKLALNQAMPMTLLGRPVSDSAIAFVEDVIDRLLKREKNNNRRGKGKLLPTFKALVGAIVADLLKAAKHPPVLPDSTGATARDKTAHGWAYHAEGDRGFIDSEHAFTGGMFRQCTKGLEALGYLERVPGFSYVPPSPFGHRDTDNAGGKVSRYRATPKLMKLASRQYVQLSRFKTHFKYALPKTVIELRTPKTDEDGVSIEGGGKSIQFRPTDQTAYFQEQVREINAFLADVAIEGGDHWAFMRIFNDGNADNPTFGKGGRLYSLGPDHYQNLSKEQRLKMTFDGEPVCEIDIHACALTLTYGLFGRQLPGSYDDDLYAIDGIDRNAIKAWVTVASGMGKAPQRWTDDMVARFLKKTGKNLRAYKIAEVGKRVLEKHPVMAEWLAQTDYDSKHLTYRESAIIIETMLRLLREYGIPSLPVHDSLIVKVKDAATVIGILKGSFAAWQKVVPRLRVSYPRGCKATFRVSDIEPNWPAHMLEKMAKVASDS